jgi:hypothetical protein
MEMGALPSGRGIHINYASGETHSLLSYARTETTLCLCIQDLPAHCGQLVIASGIMHPYTMTTVHLYSHVVKYPSQQPFEDIVLIDVV